MTAITLEVSEGKAVCSKCNKSYSGAAKRWVHNCVENAEPILETRVGTLLHKRLTQLWIKPANCKCLKRIRLMNIRGAEWCRDNVDKIVGWLREAAKERGIPFIEYAARYLVQQSVKEALVNLERQEQARGRDTTETDSEHARR